MQALGLLETTGWTPAMVAVDAMSKSGTVRVVQAEINDFLGYIIKLVGSTADVKAAIAAGNAVAEQMGGEPRSQVISRPDDEAWKGIESKTEYNPLIQQATVTTVGSPAESAETTSEAPTMSDSTQALGFIETQGYTAVFAAIDDACKAANVEVCGKEKLGGGYVTVVVRGDVAAVKAAIDAGQETAARLGTLIAAHVIPRPSDSVLALLPE